MLNFEEELKNFEELPEIDAVKLSVYETGVTDLTDVMQRMMEPQNTSLGMQQR